MPERDCLFLAGSAVTNLSLFLLAPYSYSGEGWKWERKIKVEGWKDSAISYLLGAGLAGGTGTGTGRGTVLLYYGAR